MTVDYDAQAFAAAFAADPTDDDTLDHHAARLTGWPSVNVDDAEDYLLWMVGFALVDGGDRDWLDVDAASIVYDAAVAEAHPAPCWRAYQELIWTGRLDDTLDHHAARLVAGKEEEEKEE
jgi:hypothetical protein